MTAAVGADRGGGRDCDRSLGLGRVVLGDGRRRRGADVAVLKLGAALRNRGGGGARRRRLADAVLGRAVLEAGVHVELEFAQLVVQPLDLELQLLDLAVQGADLVFQPVDAQDGRGVGAPGALVAIVGGRTIEELGVGRAGAHDEGGDGCGQKILTQSGK